MADTEEHKKVVEIKKGTKENFEAFECFIARTYEIEANLDESSLIGSQCEKFFACGSVQLPCKCLTLTSLRFFFDFLLLPCYEVVSGGRKYGHRRNDMNL